MRLLNIQQSHPERSEESQNIAMRKVFKKIFQVILITAFVFCFYPQDQVSKAASSNWKYKGGTITTYWDTMYYDQEARDLVDYMKNIGVNTIAFGVTWYQDSLTSNSIHRHAITGHVKTPSDGSLTYIIDYAHSKGLKVMLIPYLDVVTKSKEQPWRGNINPSNKQKWFKNYKSFILHYTSLAKSHRVEMFCIGAELRLMTINNGNLSFWQDIQNAVKGQYSGIVTYAATWEGYKGAEYLNIPKQFWQKLDLLGLNIYPTISENRIPSIEELKLAWQPILKDVQRWQKGIGKSVILPEIGFRSTEYTALHPGYWNKAYNSLGQFNCYKATFEVLKNKDWLSGVFWFEFTFDYHVYGRGKGVGDVGFNPQGKSAENVLKWEYGKMRNEIITAAGPSGGPHIRSFNDKGDSTSTSFFAYDEDFRGGVRVATGDVDGDGIDEIVAGAGPGGGPHVRVFEKNGKFKMDFWPFHQDFRGGVDVACGDVDGDGIDEIAMSQYSQGQAWIKVYKFNSQRTILGEWNAYKDFEGGATVALGDIDQDGKAEVITGAGPGGGPHVRVFEANGKYLSDFWPFHQAFSGGVDVVAGDVDGDGRDEIAMSQRSNGEAWMKVYRYNSAHTILGEWRAYPQGVECGANIDMFDIDRDGKAEVITGAGQGGGPHIRAFEASGKAKSLSFFAYDKNFRGGTSISGMAVKQEGL